ncbi:hypothetical protein EA462_12730 [Natrarchaeobius halalkaliphilus]|uniref:Uncharacterized protein n=1 Tax=Natrarchaeobius halalkaliphilus TaxID=1679091 RepID=A0A3N6LQI4_9EURY|nr:hypothetical protein EA462_12730 [Natrarchaeobius halalkaliphilus]
MYSRFNRIIGVFILARASCETVNIDRIRDGTVCPDCDAPLERGHHKDRPALVCRQCGVPRVVSYPVSDSR